MTGLTRNFWKLRPFRPLKMSAAQGFARVRISQFHIVLACFSCILPEQGLHLRYTESCPRGRRCDTRNPPRLRFSRPPVSLCFQGFSRVLKTKYFAVLTRRSNILVFPLFWGSRCSDRVWHTRRGIEVVITGLTRNHVSTLEVQTAEKPVTMRVCGQVQIVNWGLFYPVVLPNFHGLNFAGKWL